MKRLVLGIFIGAALVLIVLWIAAYHADAAFSEADFGSLARLVQSRLGTVVIKSAATEVSDEESADAFVTVTRAIAVAEAALAQPHLLPPDSEGLESLDPDARLDAWKRPFCLWTLADRVIVASLGPHKDRYGTCGDLSMIRAELLALSENVPYRFPSGTLVLAVSRQAKKG